MVHDLAILKLVILLTLANGAPVIAKRVLGGWLAYPLDGGARFLDGRPLLGSSKTIRGVVLAVLVTSLGAALLGLGASLGLLVGSLSMAGDLVSSFVKRRLALRPSSRATGLDQVPEALFPLLACRTALALTAFDIALTVAIFFVGEVALSRLLYWLRIRDRPY
jgi:CDP-diglyceride synthetase